MQDVKVTPPDAGANEVCDRDMAMGRIQGIDALARQFEEVGDLGYFIFDAVIEEFLYVSSGFGRIYGVDAKTHMESIKSLNDDLALIIQEDRERVLASYQEILCQGMNCIVEFRIQRSDGKIRWLRESSTAIQIENGKVMLTIGAVQDITTQLIFGNELFKAKHKMEKILDERTAELDDTVNLLQREIRERKHVAVILHRQARNIGRVLIADIERQRPVSPAPEIDDEICHGRPEDAGDQYNGRAEWHGFGAVPRHNLELPSPCRSTLTKSLAWARSTADCLVISETPM